MQPGIVRISTESLLQTRLFTVERRWYARGDAEPLQRDIVVHPGAVVILPFLDDARVVMIHNYRCAVEQELLELPAGTLEPGEAPIATAARELIEETGYRAESLEPLVEFYMSPGILSEHMHAFAARGLDWAGQDLDAGEDIRVEVVDIADVRRRMSAGRIRDAKTLATLGVAMGRGMLGTTG